MLLGCPWEKLLFQEGLPCPSPRACRLVQARVWSPKASKVRGDGKRGGEGHDFPAHPRPGLGVSTETCNRHLQMPPDSVGTGRHPSKRRPGLWLLPAWHLLPSPQDRAAAEQGLKSQLAHLPLAQMGLGPLSMLPAPALLTGRWIRAGNGSGRLVLPWAMLGTAAFLVAPWGGGGLSQSPAPVLLTAHSRCSGPATSSSTPSASPGLTAAGWAGRNQGRSRRRDEDQGTTPENSSCL